MWHLFSNARKMNRQTFIVHDRTGVEAGSQEPKVAQAHFLRDCILACGSFFSRSGTSRHNVLETAGCKSFLREILCYGCACQVSPSVAEVAGATDIVEALICCYDCHKACALCHRGSKLRETSHTIIELMTHMTCRRIHDQVLAWSAVFP